MHSGYLIVKGFTDNDLVKSHCQVLFSQSIKRGTMNAVQGQWEEDNSFSQEKEAWRKEQQYHEFENNMNRYKKENESSILIFARDLYMVVTFLGVAYLIIEPMI